MVQPSNGFRLEKIEGTGFSKTIHNTVISLFIMTPHIHRF